MIFAEIIIYVAFGVFFISMITKGVKKMENIRVEQAAEAARKAEGNNNADSESTLDGAELESDVTDNSGKFDE